MLVRLILSAVIYGDRKDTSEFMRQINANTQEAQTLSWERQKSYFENKLSQFDLSSILNQTRSSIALQCLEAARQPSGIYRLHVPTGAGKTLCTLRYALTHAEQYHKKRIIFIIPLLSVLDQNVKVIRDYVPDESEVLEHHSNVIRDLADCEELDRYEFLGESWNYPIVVSTLVQFLNILFEGFGRRPGMEQLSSFNSDVPAT